MGQPPSAVSLTSRGRLAHTDITFLTVNKFWTWFRHSAHSRAQRATVAATQVGQRQRQSRGHHQDR